MLRPSRRCAENPNLDCVAFQMRIAEGLLSLTIRSWNGLPDYKWEILLTFLLPGENARGQVRNVLVLMLCTGTCSGDL